MSKQVQDAYIVAAVRTPIGKAPRGMFRNTRPDDLLVTAIRAAMAKVPSLDPAAVEDAIIGCAIPEGQQGLNVARIAVLLAGLPQSVGGVTVNRFCASGLTTIAMAADRIRVGEADVMLAGGCESMSMVPMMGNAPSMNDKIFTDENIGIAYGMGLTAEKVAQQWKVSREAQDEFSVASHKKALAAQQSGAFADELTPVAISERTPNLATGEITVKNRSADTDEGPRADTSMEGLAKLRAVFAAKGSVTAGNSSQTSDGAGALLIVSERALKQYNLTPLARFVSFGIKGVDPKIMGIGPEGSDSAGLEARRAEAGRPRLDRVERSLRRAGTGGDRRPRIEPRGGQPQWRRHRAGPPARRHRRHARGHRHPRRAAYRQEVQHGHHVRGHRHGRGRHFRVALNRSAAMDRRTFLATATALPLAGCGPSEVRTFASLEAATAALDGLLKTPHRSTGAWKLAQVLEHAAQSIEYSMSGFPEMKSAAFRATIGAAAFAVFDARGAMSHSLEEPIPGAPALAEAPLVAAVARPEDLARPLCLAPRGPDAAFRLWRTQPCPVCPRPPDAPGQPLVRSGTHLKENGHVEVPARA